MWLSTHHKRVGGHVWKTPSWRGNGALANRYDTVDAAVLAGDATGNGSFVVTEDVQPFREVYNSERVSC